MNKVRVRVRVRVRARIRVRDRVRNSVWRGGLGCVHASVDGVEGVSQGSVLILPASVWWYGE